MKKLLVFLFIPFFLIGNIHAQGVYSGTLSRVQVNDGSHDNTGWIKLVSEMSTPSCSDSLWYRVDLTREDMKMAMTFALTAYMKGDPVTLGGTGTCSGNYEWLQYIVLK